MKALVCSLLVFSLSACVSKPDPLSGKILDLTYAYDSTTVFWPTEKGFWWATLCLLPIAGPKEEWSY